MSNTLVHPDVVKRWDTMLAGGSDIKQYPSLDLVRLERWFFGSQPGRMLEYACGSGTNLIHLLERGYETDAIDASIEAVKISQARVSARSDVSDRARFHHLDVNAKRLPFEDEIFDYVNCMNVLSLLASRERVEWLFAEFLRVMKPGAKIIVDINAPEADFARGMEAMGDDVYTYKGQDGMAVPTYCPPEERFHEVVARHFTIVDTGFTAFSYMDSQIREFIVCAHKAECGSQLRGAGSLSQNK